MRIPATPIPVPGWIRSFVWFLPTEINAASVLGAIGKRSVLAEPIRTIQAHAVMGQGGVVLTNTLIASAAFEAAVTGGVRFDDILDKSQVQIPVQLAFASNGKLDELRNIGRVEWPMRKTDFIPNWVTLGAMTITS